MQTNKILQYGYEWVGFLEGKKIIFKRLHQKNYKKKCGTWLLKIIILLIFFLDVRSIIPKNCKKMEVDTYKKQIFEIIWEIIPYGVFFRVFLCINFFLLNTYNICLWSTHKITPVFFNKWNNTRHGNKLTSDFRSPGIRVWV